MKMSKSQEEIEQGYNFTVSLIEKSYAEEIITAQRARREALDRAWDSRQRELKNLKISV